MVWLTLFLSVERPRPVRVLLSAGSDVVLMRRGNLCQCQTMSDGLVAATENGHSVDRFTAYHSPFVAVGVVGAHSAHGVRNSSRSSRPARDELL